MATKVAAKVTRAVSTKLATKVTRKGAKKVATKVTTKVATKVTRKGSTKGSKKGAIGDKRSLFHMARQSKRANNFKNFFDVLFKPFTSDLFYRNNRFIQSIQKGFENLLKSLHESSQRLKS